MADEETSAHSGILEEAYHSAFRLISSVPGPVRRIRLQAGEVMIDVEWLDPAQVAAAGTSAAAVVAAAGATAAAPVPSGDAATAADSAEVLHYICASMVGTYYQAPEPGAEPFIREGDLIDEGQRIAILEAMKIMMPIEADRAGEVVKILVPNATPVEYGERLVAVRPAA
jgi:acetyl-CoA carboxylase biotin carboxyl carrier protein